jgi:Uma2 family endonuclease
MEGGATHGFWASVTLLEEEIVIVKLGGSMTLRDVKLTIEDYEAFPDDGMRHEIIDGEHYVTASPITRHQAISRNLTVRLGSFLLEQPLGRLFPAPCDVYLSRFDVVVPDLVFVSTAGKAVITAKNIQGPPDLLIEILSPGTRRKDERIKRDRYALFGVREYWIVDPELETIKVMELGASGYEPPREVALERAEHISSRVLPGLHLPLDQIFTD